jgi:DNA-binding protein HU-beta
VERAIKNLDNMVTEQQMPDVMSKSELIQRIAEKCSKLTRDEVKQVLDALAEVGQAEVRTAGVFLLPGFAKFAVVERPATPAHDGINPFTKAPMRFEARPASKAVKVRPVKAIKDAVS